MDTPVLFQVNTRFSKRAGAGPHARFFLLLCERYVAFRNTRRIPAVLWKTQNFSNSRRFLLWHRLCYATRHGSLKFSVARFFFAQEIFVTTKFDRAQTFLPLWDIAEM